MYDFKEGFKYALHQMPSTLGSLSAEHYVGTIQKEVDHMMFKMYDEAQQRQNLDASRLQGFDAEVWHTYTQRINATVKGHSPSAMMPESTTVGSEDIITNNGNAYSSKYYKTAAQSVGQQSTTIEARYQMLKSKAEQRGDIFMSREEYMEKYFPHAKDSSQSIYFSQGRLVPADQLEEGRRILQQRIAKERAAGRTGVANNLQEVLDSLTDTIDDGKGNKSIQLTREQAQMLARASKDGTLDEVLNKLGITLKDLIKPEDIMREAFKAGMSAAMLSFVLNVAPILVNTISLLVQSGEIDVEKLKKDGLVSVSQTAKSFVLGSISASITIAAQSGFLGTAMKTVDPTIIGTVVALTYNSIENAIKVAIGKMTKREYAQNMMRSCFVSAFSLGMGSLLQTAFAEIPVFPYMIGSFVGSVIGGFAYNVTEKVFLSYCIHSGCTFFGLVEQDYELDESVLEEMELSVFKEESIDLYPYEYDSFEIEKFNYEGFQYERIGISIIRRGVIGVFSIGYL